MSDANSDTLYAKNPATGETLGQVPVASARDVEAAVTRARHAQAEWARVPVKQRAQQLLGFGEQLVRFAEDLVDLLVLETGKPRLEALIHEVFVLCDLIGWQCKNAPRALAGRDEPLHLLKHRKSRVSYVPRGIVGIISPWNYPLMLPFSDVAQATLAGNAVVLKPSEHAPLIALKAKHLWDASGMPKELLQVVTGGAATGSALLDAGIDKLAFTGGVESGRKVAEQCAKNLIECVLELGGKAPLIVCEDADLERAARAIIWGGFSNAGQACVSVERVLCHEVVYDELTRRSVELCNELRQGSVSDGEVEVGPVVLGHKLDHLDELVQDALAKGAKLGCGGARLQRRGNFYAPTLLLDCTPSMRVMREEIFGPIVPLMAVKDDAEAIRVANDSPLGLTSYVFSQDTEHAATLAAQLRAGSTVINDVHSDIASPEVPFGGVKHSGYGRIHGIEGLRGMCHVKHVSVNRTALPKRSPFWFPYHQADFARVLAGMRLLFSGSGPLGRLSRWL